MSIKPITQKKEWISCLLGAFSVSFLLFNRLFPEYFWNRSLVVQILLLLGITTGGGLICLFLVSRLFLPALIQIPHRQRHILVVLAVTISMVWVGFSLADRHGPNAISSPLTYPITRPHTIEINTTGDKNPSSGGNMVKVLLVEVKDDDGQLVTLHPIENSGWDIKSNMYFSNATRPAELILGYDGKASKGQINILLEAGPNAGIVDVRLDGETYHIDLFQPTRAENQILVPVTLTPEEKVQMTCFALVEAFALGLLLFILMVILVVIRHSASDYQKDIDLPADEGHYGRYASIPLLVCCILVIIWQSTFSVSSDRLDPTWKLRAAYGIRENFDFTYYYYYLNIFPLYSNDSGAVAENFSREGAQSIIREKPKSLLTDKAMTILDGDLGRNWVYLPAAFLRDRPDLSDFSWLRQWFFTLALISILIGAWFVNRLPLGFFLAVFLGSNPFQLFHTYSDPNIFSFPISSALLLLGFFFPLLFNRKLPGVYPVLLCLLSGLFIASLRQIRSENVPVLLSCAAAVLFYPHLTHWKKYGLVALIIAAFFGMSQFWKMYFDNKFEQAVQVVEQSGGTPYKDMRYEYHIIWHSIFSGLGDYDTKYGYAWNDTAAFKYAVPILEKQGKLPHDFDALIGVWYNNQSPYPKPFWLIDGYEDILREKVLGDILSDPGWYLDILAKRALRILTDTTPVSLALGARRVNLPLNGLILIPTLIIFIYLGNWPYLKLTCFTLPLAAVPFIIYSDAGTTHYTVFLQVIFAIYLNIIWQVLNQGYNKLKNGQGRRIFSR